MLIKGTGVELTIEEIEKFLDGDLAAEAPAAESNEGTSPAAQVDLANGEGTEDKTKSVEEKVIETKAFAHRLKQSTEKARQEERDNIAKSLGYESFEQMQKAREQELLKEKGLDPDEVSPVVEQIVEKRLAEDPRLKELDEFKQAKAQEWAKKELAELNALTGGKIAKLEDVPKNVIELWKQKGSLKAAYLELEGEKLIREMQTGVAGVQSKGTTSHLNTPQGTPAPVQDKNKRPLTEKEKEVYKLFNPDVTEEQLSKMYKEI